MAGTREFGRVAIVGAGLIGASFGAAVQKACSDVSIVAFDRPDVLRKLGERYSHWERSGDLSEALRHADLVYIALPVVATIEMLPEIASKCGPQALVTDSGSTKSKICEQARRCFPGANSSGAKFLGGHPIAGKENSGVENADAKLFQGTRYALMASASEQQSDERVLRFVELLKLIGADPLWMEEDVHDWALGVTSHMPQMLAVALAHVMANESDENGLPLSVAGNGLRDMLRIAGSSYEMWRDICLTNTENIARSLDRLTQALDFLRTHLTTRELEREFQNANEVYDLLRRISQDTTASVELPREPLAERARQNG